MGSLKAVLVPIIVLIFACDNSSVSYFGIQTWSLPASETQNAAVTLQLYWNLLKFECNVAPMARSKWYYCYTNSTDTTITNSDEQKYFIKIYHNNRDGLVLDGIIIVDEDNYSYHIDTFCVPQQLAQWAQVTPIMGSTKCSTFLTKHIIEEYDYFILDQQSSTGAQHLIMVNIHFPANINDQPNQQNVGYLTSSDITQVGITTSLVNVSSISNQHINITLHLYWNLQTLQCKIVDIPPSMNNNQYWCTPDMVMNSCQRPYNYEEPNYLYTMFMEIFSWNNTYYEIVIDSILVVDESKVYYGINEFMSNGFGGSGLILTDDVTPVSVSWDEELIFNFPDSYQQGTIEFDVETNGTAMSCPPIPQATQQPTPQNVEILPSHEPTTDSPSFHMKISTTQQTLNTSATEKLQNPTSNIRTITHLDDESHETMVTLMIVLCILMIVLILIVLVFYVHWNRKRANDVAGTSAPVTGITYTQISTRTNTEMQSLNGTEEEQNPSEIIDGAR